MQETLPCRYSRRRQRRNAELSAEAALSLTRREDMLSSELARFLANLHAPEILTFARERLADPLRIPEPGPQATTDELRTRFTPMVKTGQRERVTRRCDSA